MFPLSYIWLSALSLRSILPLLGVPSILLTVFITGLQIIEFLLLLSKREYRLFDYCLPLFLLIILVVYNSATLATVNIVLGIILLKNQNIKKILTLFCFMSLFQIFLHISCIHLGKLEDVLYIMPKGIGHSLGWSNSNGPAGFYISNIIVISLFLISFLKERFTFISFLLLYPIYYIFQLTLGRTYFYGAVLFFFLIFIFKFSFFQNHFAKIYLYLPVLLYICTFLGCMLFERYPILDIIFTTRFSKNSVLLNSMGIINWILGLKIPDGPMDSAFCAQLFAGGVTSVYIFIRTYKHGVSKMNNRYMRLYFPFILYMLASGFAENTFSSFSVNTIIFYKILIDNICFTNKLYKNPYLR